MRNIIIVKILLIITLNIPFLCVYADPKIANNITPVSYFVNHVQQLKELKEKLQNYRKVGIAGTSGIGKTQLVRMYASKNKDKYDLIWFIDCNLDINQEFLNLAKIINTNAKKQIIIEDTKTVRKEIMNYLSVRDRWLLVFDNNKTRNDDKINEFIEWEVNGDIIFCSQSLESLPHLIKLERFSQEDSVKLVKTLLKEQDTEAISFLVEEFKGYPILIVQGAQVLNNIEGLSYNKYKQIINKSNNKIKANIKLCIQELSPTATELLKKIAIINNQSFSKVFLKMMTSNTETLEDDIYQLTKFLLISNIAIKDDDPLFEMHNVIAEVIENINGKEKNKEYLGGMVDNILNKSFPKGVARRHMVRNLPTIDQNLQIILQNAEKYQIQVLKNLELRLEIFGTAVNNGDYDKSQIMMEWFLNKEKNKEFDIAAMNNHQLYVYALYLDVIGCYYDFALSNTMKASEYFMKAKKISDKVYGYEYMKFNITYQLFRVLVDIGKIKEAQHNIEEVEKIYKQGIENNTIEQSEECYLYIGKAKLFLAQGKYDDALRQVDSGIEILKNSGLNKSDLFIEASYQLKIEILNHLKRYKEADTLILWLLEIYKPLISPDHEIFAKLYTKLAETNYGKEQYTEGLQNAENAIKIFSKVRNIREDKMQFSKDIDLAKTLVVMADCLSSLDNTDKALEVYEKAEAIYKDIYIGNFSSSLGLRRILFQGTKTACKKPNKSNKFWYKHFYSQLRSIFGINIPEVKEIEQICLQRYVIRTN